jgi:hypothetical protein
MTVFFVVFKRNDKQNHNVEKFRKACVFVNLLRVSRLDVTEVLALISLNQEPILIKVESGSV